jgi:outer membrane protein TolC
VFHRISPALRPLRNRFCNVDRRRMLRAACAMVPLVLACGCANFSPDGGMDLVAAIVGETTGKEVAAIRSPEEAAAVRARVEHLLRRPLTADSAVQIALLNNRGLQAAYNELGIAEAIFVEANLPPNPAISLQRIAGSLQIEIERRIVADVLALATLPARSEIAADRFRQAQFRAASETLRVAAEARRAYYRAVSARALAGFLEQAVATARSASDLAKRLAESGAMNKLDQAREQVFYVEITAQFGKAQQLALLERERLVRAMGLWGNEPAFRLPSALPPLPARLRSLPKVETEAIARRLDLRIARLELDALAKSYDLTSATRFINLLDVSAVDKTTIDRPTAEHIRERGFDVEVQIPIFDFGEVRVREAEQTYMQAVNRLTERAVNVRSEARAAYQSYRSNYEIAMRYRNDVLPLRKIISDETLLRYNAMMVDVFSLLTEARQRIASTVAAIEAQRDFWLSSVDLDAAILAGGAGPAQEIAPGIGIAASPADNH